jgi:serine phosphatase RsbU (regulator of sigma subunit)
MRFFAVYAVWNGSCFLPGTTMDTLPLLDLLDLASPAPANEGPELVTEPAMNLPLASELRIATKQSAQFGAGGDFFEVFQHADGRVSAVVADVCGNGRAAAQVAARIRPFLHASLMRGDSPGAVLAAFNDGLVRHELAERFVTAVAVRVDVATGVVEIACAGHMGPFLRRASGRVCAIDRAMGVPLGLLAGESYEEVTLQVEPDDALVLVTDGVTDPLSTDGDPLGEEALSRRLERSRHATIDICETLLVTDSKGRDDATVLVLHLPTRSSAPIAA